MLQMLRAGEVLIKMLANKLTYFAALLETSIKKCKKVGEIHKLGKKKTLNSQFQCGNFENLRVITIFQKCLNNKLLLD